MKSIFTLLFLSLVVLAAAQTTFKARLFPATDSSYLTKSAQLNDGSLVSVGGIGNNGVLWLVKTNTAGTVLASKKIDGTGSGKGVSVVKTSDGGFAVTCVINKQMGLVRFNADLSLVWIRSYYVGTSSRALTLVQTADGGFLLAGYTGNDAGKTAACFVRVSPDGDVGYEQSYFDFSQDSCFVNGLSPTTDGNYAFIATKQNGSGANNTSYIGKVDSYGTIVWAETWTDVDAAYQEFDGVIGTSDGGVVATGWATVDGINNPDQMIMVKFDGGGGLIWSYVLGNDAASRGYTVTEDKAGGYLFGGKGSYAGSSYAYVVKTTSDGNLVWKKTFETRVDGYTEFYGLTGTSDSGFVATGDGSFADGAGGYAGAGIVYKFNSSFDACGETAGTAGGNLGYFGTADPDNPVATRIDFDNSDPDLPFLLTDVNNRVDDVCNSFPVHFNSFTAVPQGKSVGVNWTTANEVNADYFVVERSGDKGLFIALQKVAAKGSSSVTHSYGINDLQPLAGTSYYRLKEVDKDGKITYSSIIPVTVMSNGTVVISPNSVQNTIHVVIQSVASNTVTLQVVDMRGNVLAAQTKAVSIGRNEISIPASSLARGVYVLKVIDSRSTQTIRFVKE